MVPKGSAISLPCGRDFGQSQSPTAGMKAHPLASVDRVQGEMMQIGILSDTHDQVERTVDAVAMLVAEGAEALLHCGDVMGPEVVAECGRLPSFFVFGNNDLDREAPPSCNYGHRREMFGSWRCGYL